MKMSIPRRQSGFTLIDAMIAVVVLATGILALTFLQVTMLRTAADARERSVGMSLAQNVLEERRSWGAQLQANYQSLDRQGIFNGEECDYSNGSALVVPGSAGLPSEYRYCVDVKRFVATGGSFAEAPVSGTGAPAYGGVNPEFKQIVVHIGWQRQNGSWSDMRLGDALSGIPLINSTDLNNRPLGGTAVQPPPVVRYNLADLTDNTNFIPIAVGDGSGNQVAATNPTPKVIGGGVAETSFQVYTYSAANGLANVQKQIDTRVIGCQCTSKNADVLASPETTTTNETFLTRPLRASFWDGARYTEPKAADYRSSDLIGQPRATAVSGQSPFCDVCCRDHHDPSSVSYQGSLPGEADDIPKFDPYRSSHVHYQDPSGDADSNRVTGSGQNYNEVCRVVRVDGIYRVTQDPLLDHFALIPTNNDAISFSTSGAAVGYQNFVQSYIEDRILPLIGYRWDVNRVDVRALEDANGLNSQAANAIDINQNDRRYLQNRSILLDVLGHHAKTKIQECIDQTGTDAPSDLACALRHTSFASVNLTELSRWSVVRRVENEPDPIRVQGKNFSVTTPTGAPVAGQVRDASGAIQNTFADALAAINRSIATLADRVPAFFQDAANTLWPAEDRQPFRYVGGTRPSVKITINVQGLSYFGANSGDSDAPYIGWRNDVLGTRDDCVRRPKTTEFVCDLFTADNAAAVTILMFNYNRNLTPANNKAQCLDANGKNQRYNLPRCDLFRPATFAGATFTPHDFRTRGKPRDDETSAFLGAVVDGARYNVGFEASPSNPLESYYECSTVTYLPVFDFTEGECRR
jgi:type IV pilus modification protein PilV